MHQYFGYIRVSTPRQGVRSSSLQEQKSAIEAYAHRYGLSVAAWFEERDTAAKLGRQVFATMLKELDRGNARGVIIHKIDRGARNLKDWANLAELIDRGLDVRFALDDLDLTSRGGRLSADIQAVVAADYIRNLREEVKKGFYGRLKQGVYPMRAPNGYRDMGAGRPKEPDPVQAPLVRQTFELYATGGISLKALCAEMHRRGLRNRDGGRVSKSGLATILNNSFYIGLIPIQKTGETFQGAHQPLIGKTLYDRVQAVLRGKKTGQPWKHDFLFRRLIVCARCGRQLVGESHKGRYVYYRCHGPACGATSLAEPDIEAEVRRHFALLRLDQREVRDLRDVVEEIRTDTEDDIARHKASLQLQNARCGERLARLTDALIDGLLDKQSFDARNAALLKEKRDLLDRLERVEESPSLADTLAQYFERANTAYLSYEIGNPSEKRDLVISLSSNFSGNGKYPAFALKSPFRELENWRISNQGGPCRDTVRTFVRKALQIFRSPAENDSAHSHGFAA